MLDIAQLHDAFLEIKASRPESDTITILTDRETAWKFRQAYARSMYYYWHHWKRYRAWLKRMGS